MARGRYGDREACRRLEREIYPKLGRNVYDSMLVSRQCEIYTSHIKLSTGLFTQGVDSSRQKALLLLLLFFFCYAATNDGISNSSV